MRNTKKGLFFYAFFLVVTTILWLFAKYEQRDFLTVEVWNRYLVQILGLLGIVFLTLNFVLATRLKFLEEIFGGLDKLYKYHKMSGRIGFTLIWAHPFFQIVKNFTNIEIIKLYFFPTGLLDYTLGILALYTFTVLIILTVVVKLPYHVWKYTHKLMIVGYILAAFHIYLIKSDVSDFIALRVWILGLITLGIISYIYKEFIYVTFGPRFDYTVEKVNIKNPITEIYLRPVLKKMKFVPGQFAFFSFQNSRKVSPEYHPYSISSNPKDEILRVSAKSLGDHTYTLKNLETGVKVRVLGPYGKFSSNFTHSYENEVWIAGGIGVTPFLSMLNSINAEKKIVFIYSCRNSEETVYKDEILKKVANLNNIKFICHYSDLEEYLTVEKIKQLLDFDIGLKTGIFICGPRKMMKTLSKQFRAAGVKSDNIIFEDFALK